jgi:hypothetical protein
VRLSTTRRRNLAFALMETSVAQIDATYGHLVPDSEEYLRGLLDKVRREVCRVSDSAWVKTFGLRC